MNKKNLISLAVLLVLGLLGVVVILVWPIPEVAEQQPAGPDFTAAQEPMPSTPRSAAPAPLRQAIPAPLVSWEQQLEGILNAPGDTDTAVRALLETLPGLPVEAQEQYIAYALNLGRTGDFSGAAAVYQQPGTPLSVLQAIFDEALNRPDQVKLPFLAKTADFPNHPLADEARDLLQLYMDREPGTVLPGTWEITVRDYLYKNQQD